MSVQIQKTFQDNCKTPLNRQGSSNEFANSKLSDIGGVESTIFTPYAFIVNQELPNFPGGVGEAQDGTRDTITDVDYIFQYEPDLDYISSVCKVDFKFNVCLTLLDESDDAFSNSPYGHVYCYVYKGVDWAEAYSKGPINTSTSSIPFTGNDCNVPFITKVFTATHYYNGGVKDHQSESVEYHAEVPFNRGDKLFVFVYLDAQYGMQFGLNIYSGEYNTRFSPFAIDGFLAFPLTGFMGSSQVDAPYAPAAPYTAYTDNTWISNGICLSVRNSIGSTTPFVVTVNTFPGITAGVFYLKQSGYSPIKIVAASGVTLTFTGSDTTTNVGALVEVHMSSATAGVVTIYPLGYKPSANFTVTADQSYCRIEILSQVAPADPSNVYMVNEALSRAAEIITNGQMRVKSDYLGRTDSQPYTSSTDGAGSLECLTNGLLIRNYSPVKALYWGNFSTPTTVIPGTSHTPALSELTSGSPASAFYQFTNSAAITFTIPTNGTAALPIGTQILIQQSGTGLITIDPQDTGGEVVIIDCPDNNLVSAGVNTYMMITKVADNEWLLASHAPMFASFRQMFADLHAIHALGMAIEPDADRSGYDRLRVEPIEYFYNNTVLMTCENVDMVERDAEDGNMIAYLNIGYQKWEAEGTNGLDEFATKRQYRTGIKAIDTAMDKISRMVASGYAIETTRRKFFMANTTDWRFDKDMFIICLKRNGDGSLAVEQGDITDPYNIIDPATTYNWRISPVRNALRWAWFILQTLINPSTAKLIFNSGDGNFYARGEQTTDPLESGPLSESGNIDLADYASAKAPLFKPELVKFKYPLGYTQWTSIYANPYGLIGYSVNGSAVQYGWIQDLKYSVFKGTAEFTLKPKI